MRKFLLLLVFTTASSLTAQNSQMFFSEALDAHLPSYLLQVEEAIRNLEQDKVKFLFDNLVEDKLVGSLMNNFKVKNTSQKNKTLEDYEKPVMLLTYSSWRISSKGEKAALNELASQYSDDVAVVLLFWGDVKQVKKLSKGYDRNIDILYVDDSENNYSLIIKNLKHSLGLPLAYTITSEKEIIDIKRRLPNKLSQDESISTANNFELYKGMLTELLYNQQRLSDEPIVINK